MSSFMSHRQYELLKEGDPSALEAIHAHYCSRIFWIGRRILDDNFVVESLVQDTFLKLWEQRARIERPEHIFFFLRMVMKRECYSYYSQPRNKFFRKVNSLESYENYQDYLAGYYPKEDVQNQRDQEWQQKAGDRIKSVLPLLSPERKRLIELCLKYGFRYKAIAGMMGASITETSNEVKKAIEDIKTIIKQGSQLETIVKPDKDTKIQDELTEEQEKVLQLRLVKKFSFAAIAEELNLTQKEVHKEFIAAYKYMQKKHEEQLESA